MSPPSSPSRLTRLLRLGRGELVATARAVLEAVIVEIRVRRTPIEPLARRYGVPLDTRSEEQGRDRTPAGAPPQLTQQEQCHLRAITRVMRRWPFGRGSCLREALLYGRAVSSHQPVLRLGVRRGEQGLVAHAWVELPGMMLGGRRDFRTLRRFDA